MVVQRAQEKPRERAVCDSTRHCHPGVLPTHPELHVLRQGPHGTVYRFPVSESLGGGEADPCDRGNQSVHFWQASQAVLVPTSAVHLRWP